MIYITRWLRREPHKNYLIMVSRLREINEHQDSPFLKVAIYASGSRRYPEELEGLEEFVLDLRRVQTDRIPVASLAIFKAELENPTRGWVCEMDDDAQMDRPELWDESFSHYINDEGYGAMGPMSVLRRNSNKLMEFPRVVKPMTKDCMASGGCQVFGIEFLKEGLERVEEIANTVEFRFDVPMFLLADQLGYKVGECPVPFTHRISFGAKSKAQGATLEYMKMKEEQIRKDFGHMLKWFPERAREIEHQRDSTIACGYRVCGVDKPKETDDGC